MTYEVKLDVFEGPLDLLLHLIQRLEVDIYDIPMAELTQQYVEHIETMRILQLDELSEYLVIAATLIEIKSKMLLPVHEETVEDWEMNEEEDPREELVQRLLEYKRFKEASLELKEREADQSAIFSKRPIPIEGVDSDDTYEVFDLLNAFQKMLKKKEAKKRPVATVERRERTVEESMESVMDRVRTRKGRTRFEDLFDEGTVDELIVTFLAILQLLANGRVAIEQQDNFAPLWVSEKGEETDGTEERAH